MTSFSRRVSVQGIKVYSPFLKDNNILERNYIKPFWKETTLKFFFERYQNVNFFETKQHFKKKQHF
jgi:hypothetical protein